MQNNTSNIEALIEQIASQLILEIKKGFRWEKFKKISDPYQRHAYVQQHLKFLGSGSDREVYLLNNKAVLKVVRPDRKNTGGQLQNKMEVEISANTKLNTIVAKVFEHADDYSWIVSELVRPLSSNEEFETLTKVSMEDVYHILKHVQSFGSLSKAIDSFRQEIEKYEQFPGKKPQKYAQVKKYLNLLQNNKFVRNVARLVSEANMQVSDLSLYAHWGKTADGRVVLLDYGYIKPPASKDLGR